MYQFSSGFELLELTKKYSIPISEVVINYEHEMTGDDRDVIIEKMSSNLDVMRKSIERGLKEDVKSVGGFIGGDAKRLYDKIINNFTISGETVSKAVASAIAVSEVNAAMGKIVAAPTAGSSGVIPGALITIARKFGKNDDELIKSLFTSSGIGIIIAKNATLSGAEGGCQAEVGSASAMAAAALVELMGGSPDEALNAASFAIMNLLGLVCDPVAGLVEVPCVTRNAIGAANALICADLALSGMKSIIPFDEVVSAMDSVGKAMPCALRETAEGGLAKTATGIKLKMNMRE
ncbi:L-serine dehydratase, iron-sulfur-dependent, alpha subunit [Thermoanaerobacterium xylanolyticum LX-11]|uniref:L-serine dehydratase n=1 Tax=Thermoanaerobacterium xylanolyticum (strain ATCC 49914 / DSM 7097 / LX-11) TaxID=858215 RepID=F6BKK9_THEXL|nr:L-serine ammonia-lyase, iron-sulfur-dependent, subunit alpha [Thermoanaerobacterium xylanolyticum]AEF17141.1 L-serine dehydratase, iron-sulfur-dependent, alpha subunit [Thermoanaerobacterium xylanolyticum LX-11]